MPPKLAFLLGILFVAFVYRVVERRRAANVFPALFLPLLWYILVSSRSTGVWLSVLGVPLPSGGGDTEGSIVDRTVYFVLCLIGLCILSRSEEHTSELQSPCNIVCRLLLEKKKKTHYSLPRRKPLPHARPTHPVIYAP